MGMSLDGKRAVILGGTSGNGLATAKAAQREGAVVVVVVGGGMAESWEIIEPPLRDSLLHAVNLPGPAWEGGTIVHSRDTEESNLVGAAWHAQNAQTEMPADRSA